MIFKRNIQIISALLLTLPSFIIFNIYELYHTNNNYWYYFFNNHVWDEVNTYFTKLFLIDNGSFSFNLNNDSFVFITTFFSSIQNFIFYKILGFQYLNFVTNIFICFANIILFNLLFKKIFNLSDLQNIYLACFFSLTIGFGPQTYNEIFEIMTLTNSDLLAITRSESPGNSNICFLASLLLFFNRKKNFFFFLFSVLIGFYSYFYNTLILFVFFNLFFLYEIIQNKFKLTKVISFSLIISLFLFSIWCFLILQSDPKNSYQNVSISISPNDIKTLLIALFYIVLNLVSIKISKKNIRYKKNSVYLIIFQTSFLICYYSNILTNVSLGGEDHFYYYSNISYWLSIVNFIFVVNDNFKKYIFFTFPIVFIFIFISQFNYSNKYFLENKENLELQTKYFLSLQEIDSFFRKENIVVLDIITINFFNNYYKIDNSLINYFDSNFDSKNRLNRFIKVCKIMKVSNKNCYELLFRQSEIINFKKNVNMEHLFFGNDKDDNFYHSLTNDKFAVSELSEKFEIFYNKYNNYENLPNLIVVNKIDFPGLDQKIFGYKKIFTSNFFIVMKKD